MKVFDFLRRQRPNYRLPELIGKPVMFFCVNYIYTGILDEVCESTVTLSTPRVVFEKDTDTPPYFREVQPLSHPLYIMISSIESFCEVERGPLPNTVKRGKS